MDWISNLFVVLLLTDVAGTIFFLAGAVLKKTPLGSDIGVQRFLMDATLCSFLVPFVYLVLYLDKRINTIELESDINLFYSTPSIRRFNAVLGCIWIGMFFGLLLYRLYRRHRWTMICRGNIPEEDKAVFEVFESVSAALGISGKVSLYRNDSIDVPCITYHHGFVVMLPLVNYTEKEAEVIFYHELCHFLNHDMYVKTIGCIVALLHVFNPAVHILLARMDLLCEKYCDRAACKKGKVAFTREEYFQTIFDLLLTDGREERYQLFALVDSISNYERRVKFMLNSHKYGRMKKGVMLVIAACFLLGCSTSALAAGKGVENAYASLAEGTSVKAEEIVKDLNVTSVTDDDALLKLMKEYDLNPEDVIMTGDEVTAGPGRETRGIVWTIPAGKTYMSSGFDVKIGDKMTATVVGTPEDLEYESGIKDGKDIMNYTTGSGTIAYEFKVTVRGRHYFYVTNPSETEELHVEASVITTPKELLEGDTEQ